MLHPRGYLFVPRMISLAGAVLTLVGMGHRRDLRSLPEGTSYPHTETFYTALPSSRACVLGRPCVCQEAHPLNVRPVSRSGWLPRMKMKLGLLVLYSWNPCRPWQPLLRIRYGFDGALVAIERPFREAGS